MKFLLAIVGLVAFSVLASDASAQGGSRGVKGRFVAKEIQYVVRAVPVRERVYAPVMRRVWVPRRVAAPAGSGGTSVSVRVGSSAVSAPVTYAAPVVEQTAQVNVDVSPSVIQHTHMLANRGGLRRRNGTYIHSVGPYEKGAHFEGTGYSSESPQEALKTCYYGEKEIVESYVTRGQNGWYATARYR